ncbi:MAG: copper oxidase, partial [Deltaproteobacteria bacterium]|nr:copper oxidase [Deltaproteobacteria bacterium]
MTHRKNPVSRRDALKRGVIGAAGLAVSAKAVAAAAELADRAHDPATAGTVGVVTRDGFDPMAFLEHFDYGRVSRLPSGQTL